MGKIAFCKNCGKILNLTKIDEKNFGVCDCGFLIEINEITFDSNIEKLPVGEGIYDDNEKITPGYLHDCPKCGYPECDIYDLGVQISDESSIILYKCKKCKFVERQADGSSIA